KNSNVTLVSTPLADRDSLSQGSDFADLEGKFTGLGFDTAHLDDGWAINAYDTIRVIAKAVELLPTSIPVEASQVNSRIDNLDKVPGAGGDISFDNSNNRIGKPRVVRLCPPTEPTDGAQLHTKTVVVYDTERRENVC